MFATAVNELMFLFLFLLAGVVLRSVVKPLRKLYLPSGLIGGALALILGPQILGIIKIPENLQLGYWQLWACRGYGPGFLGSGES